MTPQELKVYRVLAELWEQFQKLPVEHSDDAAEVLLHIRAIQDKILARPTFREYLKAN